MDEIEKNRLERALALIRQILPLVEAAEKKFKSARNWGFLDMFGGGTLVDLIKHYKLNTAADISTGAKEPPYFARKKSFRTKTKRIKIIAQ